LKRADNPTATPVMEDGAASVHNSELEARFGESLQRMRALDVPDPQEVRIVRDRSANRFRGTDDAGRGPVQ
jgi:hypothetical protein